MSIPAPRGGAILDPRGRASRARRVSIALASAVLAGLVVLPATALGHAELDTVSPADGGTVSGPPTEIVMTFTETLDPAKSSIKLVDAGGTVIVEGSTVDTSDAKVMRLALPAGLAAATYTARWISASAQDGDLDHGTTTFTVEAAARPSPSSTPAPAESATAAASSAPPSIAPSIAPSPAASAAPVAPTASTSDAIVPIVVVLAVLVGLGLWLLRGRARSR
jgi:methionine-rich copper-binding protein CopC